MSALVVGPFTLDRPLGSGAMGVVWRATHRDGTPVAVKLLTGDAWRTARVSALVRDEVRVVAGLDHPAIVALHDTGEVGAELAAASDGRFPEGSPWLAMELAPGGDLRRAPTCWEDSRDVLMALLDGLAHAHARGVLHRDLKPDNVLRWDRRGGAPPVKLADFGLAAAIGESTQLRVGTPAYMAPEQITASWRDVGPWTDLYALGCLAWTLIAGRPPFRGRSAEILQSHLHRALPPLVPRFPVPEPVTDWLGWLLERSPRDRCQRAADAAHALLGLPAAAQGHASDASEIARSDTWASTLDVIASDEVIAAARPRGSAAAPPPFPASPREASLATVHLAEAGRGLFTLRVPRLVGREELRRRAWEELAAVVQTRAPRAYLLRGPAGTGKKRLARWLAERAHELGQAEVVHATRDLRHAVASRLGVLGLDADATAARLGSLGWSAPEATLAARAFAEEERFEEIAEVALAHIAGERIAVVLLDDVHDDAADLALVPRLLRGAAPVLCVATADDAALDDGSRVARAWGAALAEGALEATVGPLDPDETAALVRGLLGLAPATAALVEEACAGTPGVAHEIVAAWVDRDVLRPSPDGFVGPPEPPARRGAPAWESARDRIRDAGGARALEVAEALGPLVHGDVFREVCDALGVIAGAGFVDQLLRLRLAQAVDREVWRLVGPRAPTSDAAVHRACAAAWRRRNAIERVARHLLAAGDLAEALDPLVEAANAAAHAGDTARAELRMAEWDRAVDALGLTADDPRRALGLARRSGLLRSAGRTEEAHACATRALAIPGIGPEARARGWAELCACAQNLGASPADVEPLLLGAIAAYREAGRPDLVASLLVGSAWHAIGFGELDRAERLAHEAEASAPQRSLKARLLRLRSAIARDRGDRARGYELLRAAVPELPAGGRAIDVANVHNELGHLAETFDPDAAEGFYRTSMAAYDRIGGWRRCLPRVNLARWLLLRGRTDEASRVVAEAVRDARSRPGHPVVAVVAAVHAAVLAAESDADGFEAALADVEAFRPGFGFNAADLVPLLEPALDAARANGWDGRAQRLARVLARLGA